MLRWWSSRGSFYHQYQFPHSLLIERCFEVLMFEIRNCHEKLNFTTNMPLETTGRCSSEAQQVSDSTQETRQWSGGAKVPGMFKRQWSLPSSFQSARVKDLQTMGSVGMNHARGKWYKKVCNVSSLQKQMQLKDHVRVAGTNWEFLSLHVVLLVWLFALG